MNSGLLQAYLSLAEDPVCAARDKFGVVHRAILKDSSPTGYVVWLIDNYRKIIAALPTDYHPEQMHNAALSVRVAQCQSRFLGKSKSEEGNLSTGRRVIISVLSHGRNESIGPTVLIFDENFESITHVSSRL